MEHSWLYYPEGAMSCSDWLSITDKCWNVLDNNWQVVSANTELK
jgi:hypothetical protein